MLITAFQNYVLSNGMEILGDAFSLEFTAAIFVCAIIFFCGRAMRERAVLV